MIDRFIIDIAQDRSWATAKNDDHPVFAFYFKKETYYELQNTYIKEDIKKAGVYILLGYNESKNAISNIYVGEGDSIYNRLKTQRHFYSNWCQEVIVFTSNKDYNKNQLCHAEEIILTKLKRINKQANFHNGQEKCNLKISDRDKHKLESDINSFWYLLKKMDFNYFDVGVDIQKLGTTKQSRKTKIDISNKTKKELKQGLPKEIRVFISDNYNRPLESGANAKAIFYPDTEKIIIKSGKFTNFFKYYMLKGGSHEREGKRIKKLRQELQTTKKGEFFYINKDSKPLSPSAACTIFIGDTCNGWNWWKVKDPNTSKVSSLNYYTGRVPKELFLKDQHLKKPISYIDEDKIYVKMERRDSYADGIYFKSSGKFLLLKGAYWDGVIPQFTTESVRKRLEEIKQSNFVKKDGNGYKFVEDVEFATSSGACAMLVGTTCSGPLTWIDKETGKTLKDLLDL